MFKAATMIRKGAALCAVAAVITLSACSSSDVIQPDTSFDDTDVPTQKHNPPPTEDVPVDGGGQPEPPQEAQDESGVVTKGDEAVTPQG